MKSAAAVVITVLATSTASAAANEDDLLSANVNDLCTGRPDNEYFRLTTEGDCRDVVRCDRAGVSGVIRLATVKCPNSLAFDLGLQGRRKRRFQIDLSSTTVHPYLAEIKQNGNNMQQSRFIYLVLQILSTN